MAGDATTTFKGLAAGNRLTGANVQTGSCASDGEKTPTVEACPMFLFIGAVYGIIRVLSYQA
jgi:hypothetical protein